MNNPPPDGDKPRSNPLWRKLAKSRDWTPEEVAAAVKHLKENRPKEWAELERLELTTGDLRGSEASGLIHGALTRMHPECELNEISELKFAVRLVRRADLDLK